MARFLILWLFWSVFFMIINLPIYTVYSLKFGVYFAGCSSLSAFLALFTDTMMHLNRIIEKLK